MRARKMPQDEPEPTDEWFGTSILLTAVDERPGDGFPKNPPENLPLIFWHIFEEHAFSCHTGRGHPTWSN